MTRRQLIILGLAAIVIGTIAFITGQREDTRHAPPPQTRLYPGLEDQINSVADVTLSPAGKSAIHIDREGQTWSVRDKGGYPADVTRLRELLIKLARSAIIEEKTRNPDKYARLGVEDPDRPDARGTGLQVRDEDKRIVADLVIGDSATGDEGYVRKAGEQQSWLVSEHLSVPTLAKDWLAKDLVRLPLTQIHQVSRQPPQGSAFLVIRANSERTTDDEFTLASIPEGASVKTRELRRIASALGNLELNDVYPDAEAPTGEGPWDLTVFTTIQGIVIETRTRELDGTHYLKLDARYQRPTQKQESGTQDAAAQAEQEATRLQEQFAGWTFVIPDFKAASLTLTLDAVTEVATPTPQAEPTQQDEAPNDNDEQGTGQPQ